MSGIDLESSDLQQDYRIQLSNFEGPLDLLLFLIRKNELEITDIPIAEITRQYMEYIDLMKDLNLEIAGEFILMAATLMQIKVKMLLPRPELEGEDETEMDPRAELVRQLLEYRRYKEVAETLSTIEDRQRRMFPRSNFEWQKSYHHTERELDLKDITLFDLLTAFKIALENMPRETVHQVGELGISVEDQITFLTGLLEKKERLAFSELARSFTHRVVVVVTFMAILELIKRHDVVVKQSETFGEIWILRR